MNVLINVKSVFTVSNKMKHNDGTEWSSLAAMLTVPKLYTGQSGGYVETRYGEHTQNSLGTDGNIEILELMTESHLMHIRRNRII
jgi:hypothetical protein